MELAVGVAVSLAVIIILAWTVSVRFGLLTVSRFLAPRPLPTASLGIALTPAAAALHRELRVADLHCDAVLWTRNLTRRANWGHLDFPRMLDGNCAVQHFLTVTEFPRRINGDNLTDVSDRLTMLGIIEQWPLAAVADQTARALYHDPKSQG